MINNENFLCIPGFVRTELDLSGAELICYSIIYGFSQDGESRFNGSRQYLADWCGCSVRNVQIVLNNLVEKKLITKYEKMVNNIKVCEYVANFTPGEKSSPPGEKSSPNNIEDNIEYIDNKVLSKDNTTKIEEDVYAHMYSKEDFLHSAKHQKKKRGKSLYDKCVDEIDTYTDIPRLRNVLVEYLKFRINIKEKPLYNINQWKSLLNCLDKAVNECKKEYTDVVQQSIDKGWLSFYPIKEYKNKKDVFSEYGSVTCEKGDEDVVDEKF